jgi:calcineurin-like phosphoesterase family protein
MSPTIWFTSDLHFWHKNVIQFCNRPWTTVEEMNAGLIANWNSCVGPEDKIYIIGDMFFCGTLKAKAIMAQLNGHKYLIRGNHDWNVVKLHRAEEFGFKWAADWHCMPVGRSSECRDVKLNHFPYRGDHTTDERFLEKRPTDNGGWLLHGHVHTAWKVRDKMINVGVDVWDWKPVHISQIEAIICGGA